MAICTTAGEVVVDAAVERARQQDVDRADDDEQHDAEDEDVEQRQPGADGLNPELHRGSSRRIAGTPAGTESASPIGRRRSCGAGAGCRPRSGSTSDRSCRPRRARRCRRVRRRRRAGGRGIRAARILRGELNCRPPRANPPRARVDRQVSRSQHCRARARARGAAARAPSPGAREIGTASAGSRRRLRRGLRRDVGLSPRGEHQDRHRRSVRTQPPADLETVETRQEAGRGPAGRSR